MFPRKVNPKQSQLKSSDLVKKYADTVEHIRVIAEKLESQEDLIRKLNQMNSEKNELLLEKNSQKTLDMIFDQTAIKISNFDQLKTLVVEHKQFKAQNNTLEKSNKDKAVECDKLKEEVKRISQQAKEKTAECEKLKVDLNQLAQQLKNRAAEGEKPKEEANKLATELKDKRAECDGLKE